MTTQTAPGNAMSRQGELFESDIPPWELDAASEVTAAVIALAEPPFGPFHYRVPPSLLGKLQPGMRVTVPLGKSNRKILGYCLSVEVIRQSPDALKAVINSLDEQSLCPGRLLELIRWMAAYYLVPIGQVFEAVIPAGVRSSAGTRTQRLVHLTADGQNAEKTSQLPIKQQQVIRQLELAAGPLVFEDIIALAKCSASVVHRLVKSDYLSIEERRVMVEAELVGEQSTRTRPQTLSPDQRVALEEIRQAIESLQHRTVLLHGITGSGKTEVYMQAIERVIRQGQQAIVLVPEISLTPQTRVQFKDRFGDVALLHSHMTDAQRHFQWRRIFAGEVSVIIGPRSAVFAPAPKLGLIILDEEHETSFKQDSAPRYHARDVALHRATLEKIPLVLGSATPGLETWHRAINGKYAKVTMPRRIHNRPLPSVDIVDLRSVRMLGGSRALSEPLLNNMRNVVEAGEQVILLLNRRGFATAIQCPACGDVMNCPDCDMPLTHHRDGHKAVCHYCDYTIPSPPVCPKCSFDGIRFSGMGTQRLELEIRELFPTTQVARMDSDTMRRPGAHERTLSAFRSGELQILLGTQMIAKGLDFPNVTLVGVVNADTALHFPDFRAAERTFQLITQVAGRTGRGDKPGHVIVQTYSPDHPSIVLASQHDYVAFAAAELGHREKFGYPPYGSLARVIVRGPVEATTEAFAEQFVSTLDRHRQQLGPNIRILGPAVPPIARLRGYYRFQIMLSSPDAALLNRLCARASLELEPPKDIQFVIDIDPVEML